MIHRRITSDEKNHIIKTLLALPVGSKARSKAMDELRVELMAKTHPPTLSKSYRNIWSQWCSAYSEHTKVLNNTQTLTHSHTHSPLICIIVSQAKPTDKKRGRPRAVMKDDALELLDDIHGYWLKTGNGTKRHQMQRDATEIAHARHGKGLNLDQMRLMELIVECNGQCTGKADAGARTEARRKATTYQNGIGHWACRQVARQGPRRGVPRHVALKHPRTVIYSYNSVTP